MSAQLWTMLANTRDQVSPVADPVGRWDLCSPTFRPLHLSQRIKKMQEWDQTIGGGTFSGVCRRSAESMVGKAFQFQFTQTGMIEATQGISFRLQK